MKARLINETIERGKKIVGIDTDEGFQQLIKSWTDKGIKFGWMFFKGNDMEKKREYFKKYHKYLGKYLDDLHKAGVPYEDMNFWGDHVDIKSYRISKGNWSLFMCLTREDAENLVKIIENMVPGSQDFGIQEDKENINLSEKMHIENDPEHAKWYKEHEIRTGQKRKTDLDFLDKIEETRKKLKLIK